MSDFPEAHADVSRDGTVATVTMVNPRRRNAISTKMRDSMINAFTTLNADPDVRAIVLRGADGTFCSGGDISDMQPSGSLLDYRDRMVGYHRLTRLIAAGPKPIIAAVEGYAFGAGMSIALACDHVVAARDVKMCSAFAKVGLMPDMGLLWSLTQRVGAARAKRMITRAETISAPTALEIGMIDDIADPETVNETALAIASEYANLAPAAFALVKAAFADGACGSLEDDLQYEAANQSALRLTQDHKNAVEAFINKSTPVFRGE